MSQKDMLQNQVLEEILRERATYYISKKRTLDFWITISSDFLEDEESIASRDPRNFEKIPEFLKK